MRLLSVRRRCSRRRTEGPLLWRRDEREQESRVATGFGEPVGPRRALVTARATSAVSRLRDADSNENNIVSPSA